MTKEENPPAFPFQASNGDRMCVPEYGMTLRDWFAGRAVSVILERGFTADVEAPDMAAFAARLSYNLADAMLVERSKA